MQISDQQARTVGRLSSSPRRRRERPPETPEELAARLEIAWDEVHRVAASALAAEGDPAREQRVEEVARRVLEGRYDVDPAEVVEMAERRALADRSAEL